MKRAIVVLMLFLVGVTVSAQELYTEAILERFGLEEAEIERIIAFEQQTAEGIRVHEADLNIKKAELARLLLDEEPNMRLVRRNLEETAAIEVQIRLLEIQRELSIRRVVGTDEWARIVQLLRLRREEQEMRRLMEQAGIPDEVEAELRQLEERIRDRQEELNRMIAEFREQLQTPEFRERFQQLEEDVNRLQQAVEERLHEYAEQNQRGNP
jgi:hypothetical protein